MKGTGVPELTKKQTKGLPSSCVYLEGALGLESHTCTRIRARTQTHNVTSVI